jgi:hypothetical protein
MLRSAESDTNFTKSIVTGDETWCFQYEPLTKRRQLSIIVSSYVAGLFTKPLPSNKSMRHIILPTVNDGNKTRSIKIRDL